MKRKFKPGDWVRRKGKLTTPKMQVLKYVPNKDSIVGLSDSTSYLECVWYKNGKRQSEVFHENKLIKTMDTGGLFKTFLTKTKLMKNYVLFLMFGLLTVSCNGQHSDSIKAETKESEENIVEEPKASWKVDKEFDEKGNLIRYDSIYSWSSNGAIDDFSNVDKDSLLQSFKSRFFTNFSDYDTKRFKGVFSADSLFSKHFFNDDFFRSDFGKEYMDIDKITEELFARQKKFLEKYQSEFIKSEDEN